nr:hypothetical protein [Roseobacter ponti]
MHEAREYNSAGAGGPRNISGTVHDHIMPEAELADLDGKDSALLSASGYVSKRTAPGTLAQKIPGTALSWQMHQTTRRRICGIRHTRAQ